MPIYPNQEIMLLDFDHYFEILEKRGMKTIRLRRTKTFETTRGLEVKLKDDHIWSHGDNLRKLSYLYYNSFEFWWVLAFINQKPTDSHFKVGDILLIPESPQLIIGALRA